MTEQILTDAFNVKTVRETIGYRDDATAEVVVSGDPYDDEMWMNIQVKFYLGKYSPSPYTFSLRIKELSACCGVLEIIRPHSNLSAEKFAIAMDVIVEQLGIQAHEPYNEWGNQLLATTSTESCPQWVKYMKSRKWKHFPPAINPRSGRGVTIWRKVV
jgi:hypothetical protein